MTGDAFTGGKGHEKIITLCVARVAEGDGTGVATFGGIGGIVVFENLDIGSEFELEIVEIQIGAAGHNGERTHGAREAGI